MNSVCERCGRDLWRTATLHGLIHEFEDPEQFRIVII